jgi:hypothetical protein
MTATEALSQSIQSAMEDSLPECIDIAREILSVPVQYVGGRVIRSQPGESPRLDTGALQDDTKGEVTMENGVPVMTIYWTLYYAATLELLMDRPILEPLSQRLADFLPGRLAESMR